MCLLWQQPEQREVVRGPLEGGWSGAQSIAPAAARAQQKEARDAFIEDMTDGIEALGA